MHRRTFPDQPPGHPARRHARRSGRIRFSFHPDPPPTAVERAHLFRPALFRCHRLRTAVRCGVRPAHGHAARPDALEPGAWGLDVRLQFSGAAAEPDRAPVAALRSAQLCLFYREAERGARPGAAAVRKRIPVRSRSDRRHLRPPLCSRRRGLDHLARRRADGHRFRTGHEPARADREDLPVLPALDP